jgi:hypothetical protein
MRDSATPVAIRLFIATFHPARLADPAAAVMMTDMDHRLMHAERKVIRCLIAAALVALGGCASDLGPSPAELAARWEAQNVFPQTYKQDLLAFLRTYLNDPTHVRNAAVSPPLRKTVGPAERYVACVRYNARDTVGKYAGAKDGAAIYVSGKLDKFLDGKQAQPYCHDVAYAPFPELERLTR